MKSFVEKVKYSLPHSQRKVLSNIKRFFVGFGNTYYSQNGEDIVLCSIFKSKDNGFFVDIGAHHPSRYSNTFLLYKKGWRGINIDANPDSIASLKRKRPNDINLNIGVSAEAGELDFYMFADSAVNTFSKTEAERWIHSSWNKLQKIEKVQTQPINEILKLAIPRETTIIDLISIDVEGFDLEILKTLDWDAYGPRVLVVEDTKFSASKKADSELYNLVTSKGYVLHSKLKFSLVFVQE